jgi:uncharacterized protein YigE (DUF2233 family)
MRVIFGRAWGEEMKSMLKFVLAAALIVLGGHAPAAEADKACATQVFGEARYVVCTIHLDAARPRLFWKDAGGRPYRTFAHVAAAVAATGKSLTFAMNAGMYADDFSPMGLYVEDGEEQRPANTVRLKPSTSPVPNFYKTPNGVLFIDAEGAGILPTETFLARRKKPDFATQSGPMLVIGNEVNPIFIPGSADRKRRSGVGVCKDRTLSFAISDGPVNFHDFATMFRDGLGCADALFLDGGRGAGIYVPAMAREDLSGHGGYGPIVGLVE